MKDQVFNPFLPLDTYIPDREPHVSGTHALYFIYQGSGKIDLLDFTFD